MQLWKDEEVAFDFGILTFSCPAISRFYTGRPVYNLCYNEGVYCILGKCRQWKEAMIVWHCMQICAIQETAICYYCIITINYLFIYLFYS